MDLSSSSNISEPSTNSSPKREGRHGLVTALEPLPRDDARHGGARLTGTKLPPHLVAAMHNSRFGRPPIFYMCITGSIILHIGWYKTIGILAIIVLRRKELFYVRRSMGNKGGKQTPANGKEIRLTFLFHLFMQTRLWYAQSIAFDGGIARLSGTILASTLNRTCLTSGLYQPYPNAITP